MILQKLIPLRFLHFGFFILHNPMRPWNELTRGHCGAANGSKIRLIIACKARFLIYLESFISLALRILWGNCKFSLMLHSRYDVVATVICKSWIISRQLLFYAISANLKAWFFSFLFFFLRTKIYTNKTNQTTNLY